MGRRRSRVFLAALLVIGSTSAMAQEKEVASEAAGVFRTGSGSLEYRGRQVSLTVAETVQGPLFALAPAVQILGGTLEIEPLGQGHTVTLSDEDIVLGPDSAVITLGEEIVPLSRPPMAGIGGLLVPLDFFRKTYGDRLGFEFEWLPADRRLIARRRPERALAVNIQAVETLGSTTLVLDFGDLPRYRVERVGRRLDLVILGDRIDRQTGSSRFDVAFIEDLEVRRDRVSIYLTGDAVAADPYVRRDRHGRSEVIVDIARARSVEREPLPLRTLERKKMTIVVDPGHGGEERGAVGPRGTEEKALTLLLARTLKSRLERSLSVRVLLTRNEDVDLPLETRTALANQNQADLFLSLHLNSWPGGGGARGAETYFLDMQATDQRAASAAEFENQGVTTANAEEASFDDEYGLQLLLWDLAQSRQLSESQRLANLIQQELNTALELRDRGVKQAPFRVLMGATMPAVLVELGFVSNPNEERKLQDPAYRFRLVDALVDAVARYHTLWLNRDAVATGVGAQP